MTAIGFLDIMHHARCFQRHKPLISNLVFLTILEVIINFPCLGQPPVSLPVTVLDGNTPGMVQASNYFCYKDSRGLLWMSTYVGLHRYDGKNIKVFLPDSNDSTSVVGKEVVSFFAEDKDENIWFGTDRALNWFVRDKGIFDHFYFSEYDEGEYKVQGIDGNGDIWFTFDGVVYTFDAKARKANEKARIDLNDLHDEVVLMTEFQLNAKKEVVYTFSYGSYLDDPGLEIHEFEHSELVGERICFDKTSELPLRIRDVHSYNDSILFLAALSGFYEFNLLSKSLKLLLPGSINAKDGFTGIAAFSDSSLLLARLSAQYLEYHPATEAIVGHYVLTQNGKEITYSPRNTNIDKDGGVYIYLLGVGLAFFHPSNLLFKHRKYEIETGGKPGVMELKDWGSLVETDGGRVLASSYDNGCFLFSPAGNLIEIFSTKGKGNKHLPSNRFNSVLKDSKDRIWIFHYSKFITRFEDLELKNKHSWSVDDMLWGGIERLSGEFVFLPRKGLLTGTIDIPGKPKLKMPEGIDTSLQYGRMTNHPNGLFYTSEYKRALVALDPLNEFKTVHSIPFKHVVWSVSILEGSGDFLLGSSNGLYYFDVSTNALSLLDYCACGSDINYYRIMPIGNHKYLVTSDIGLCTIDIKNRSSTLFGREHGVGTSPRAALQHSDGSIWLGSNSGILTCDTACLDKPVFPNRVNISGVLVNDKPASQLELFGESLQNLDELQEINLDYASNTLSFEFAAFSYAGINDHAYEYRMSDLEKNWVNGNGLGFARYLNIAPGNYVFEVRVKGQPSSVRTVAINIQPPIYARWWFRLLVGISAFLAIYYAVRANARRKQHIQQLRFERRLALEQERVRIATDMHDEVGSGLSALNLRAQILANQANESGLKAQLKQVADSSRQLTLKIREIIWTVNAQNDTLENLITRMHQYTQEYFEKTDTSCSFKLIGEEPESSIAGSHRREIYLAFKEALHNIFKHANASQVHIVLETSKELLLIEIKDNGVGFDTTGDDPPGNGLRSMRQRMIRVNGVFAITSNSGGTTIRFQYPIQEVA